MFKVRSVLLLSAAISLISTHAAASGITSSPPQAFGPHCIGQLTKGDRDFGRNGPTVWWRTHFNRNTRDTVSISVEMTQRETTANGTPAGDQTEGSLAAQKTLVAVAAPFAITKIWALGSTGTWRWHDIDTSPPPSSWWTSGTKTYFDTNNSQDVFPNPVWYLLGAYIMGNTIGNDIATGTCGADDSSIKITLDSVFFWYE